MPYRDVSTKRTLDGDNEVVLYSAKQHKIFDENTKPDTDGQKTKIIRQFSNGEIIIHRFFKCDGRWLGYAKTIGPRGGTNCIHGGYVYEDAKGDLTLNF